MRTLYPTLKRNVASYNPSNFYISLEDISESDLHTIRANPFTNNNIEHVKTLFHEIRHYIDHTGTLWGQKRILNYFKALNIRLNNDVVNFNKIVEYKNEQTQLFYSSYYSEEYNYLPVKHIERRWKWSSTTGLRFDSFGLPDETKPIPFIHFRSFDDRPLIRVPISIASLLETNSTADEIWWHKTFLASLSETERPFHAKFFENEILLKLIYNQDLVVYNVAVHITANLLGLTDILESFEISSSVATLTLNLPNEFVLLISHDKTKFATSEVRTKHMLKNNEYGFIFYLLIENYVSKYHQTKKFNIEDLLASSGLPTQKVIKSKVIEEMSLLYDEAKKLENFSDTFLPKLVAGNIFFNKLGVCANDCNIGEVIQENPPVLICNDTSIDFKSYSNKELTSLKPFKKLSRSEWFNISDAMNNKLTEHYEIRGA